MMHILSYSLFCIKGHHLEATDQQRPCQQHALSTHQECSVAQPTVRCLEHQYVELRGNL
jgi:hypothetical protein